MRKSIFGFMAGEMEIVDDLDAPPWSDREWAEFEREREDQGLAWERAWRARRTTSGKKGGGRLRKR